VTGGVPDGLAWLFCPADRPDRFGKAAQRSDVVILDLEDGVAPADRPRARDAVGQGGLDPARTVVRVNPVGTSDHDADLAAAERGGYRSVMLAKAESPAQVAQLAPFAVVALCETPAGVLASASIAAAATVQAMMWGAEDLIAAIGGQSSRDQSGGYRDVARHARAAVLLAAAAAGKRAIDAVYLDIADLEGLGEEAADAAASGFAAKACIHPSQVPVVRDAYRPAEELVRWARRVLDAAATEPGVFAFEGQMIDEPLIRQARTILARSGGPRP
jgi:citrate lyase subunit beta / citryl-CoA lyase